MYPIQEKIETFEDEILKIIYKIIRKSSFSPKLDVIIIISTITEKGGQCWMLTAGASSYLWRQPSGFGYSKPDQISANPAWINYTGFINL